MPAPQEKGHLLSDHDVYEFNRIRRKIDSVRGPGVVNKADSISVNAQSHSGGPKASGDASLPTPQKQGMFYGAVTVNQPGFSFIFQVDER